EPLLARGEDDGADLRVLETDALERVVQLDIDAEIVGVELQPVAGRDPARLVDIERQPRDGRLDPQAPMPVARRISVEGDHAVSSDRKGIIMHASPRAS